MGQLRIKFRISPLQFFEHLQSHFPHLFINIWGRLDDAVSLNLAPIYDMLPMLYAPEKSEVVERMFKLPRGAEIDVARVLARQFWSDLALRDDMSEVFRGIAFSNVALLDEQ